jgi:site-specific recombinase XerD
METHPLERLSEQFINDHTFSKNTEKAYRFAFQFYIEYLKEHNIIYAHTSDVIAYREHRRSLGYSSHYIYVHISALKGLYRYLRMNQKPLNLPIEYAHDIMVPIKNEKIKQRIKKPILTIEQAKQLIIRSQENRTYLWHYRDHAMIYLMITTGLRSIEMVHLKKEDYQLLSGQHILYVQRAGGNVKREYVKLSSGAQKALQEYLTMRQDDNPYLFISHKKVSPKLHLSPTFFTYWFRTLLKKCGLEEYGFTPHCLRHTAAYMNLLRGGTLEQTRQLLRHVNLQSTKLYQDYINRLNDDTEFQLEQYILGEQPFKYDIEEYYIVLE